MEPKFGDLIQITNPEHTWYPAVLVVDEATSWGVRAYAIVPKGNNTPQSTVRAFNRLETADFATVGRAEVMVES